MVLPVVIYPNRGLLRVCNPVDVSVPPDWSLIADMTETLAHFKGVGLAANQVGRGQALFLMQDSEMGIPLAIANPVILREANKVEMIEGCLSLPGVAAKVGRWEYIKIRCHVAQSYVNKWGEEELEFIGLRAQIAQHEIDHLMGRIFPDRLDFVTKHSLLSVFSRPNSGLSVVK
jgi:peptide deformylase